MPNEMMIFFGGEIKALDDGKIGGRLVSFSDENSPDLAGDYFTKDTDFGFVDGMKTAVYLNHRLPLKTKDGKKVAVKEKIGEATLKSDDEGILIEAILFEREKYEKALASMGWSSGTAGHLVDREKKGTANFVKTWPLGLDASITPRPCQPHKTTLSLKSWELELETKADMPMSGADIFNQNLTQEQLTFWRVENAYCNSAKDIAKAASTSEITGVEVDIDARVDEAAAAFALRIASITKQQIKDWLEGDMEHEFYLKSLLDAVISTGLREGLTFEDRLDVVLAAAEKITADAKSICEMRATKAGAKISKARRERLKEIMGQLESLMMEVEPMDDKKKSIEPDELSSLAAQFEQTRLRQTMARQGGQAHAGQG